MITTQKKMTHHYNSTNSQMFRVGNTGSFWRVFSNVGPVYHMIRKVVDCRRVLIGVVKDRERNMELASTYGDFDGDFGVHTVLVVKIDAIHVQSLQAGLTSGPHILRVASH